MGKSDLLYKVSLEDDLLILQNMVIFSETYLMADVRKDKGVSTGGR